MSEQHAVMYVLCHSYTINEGDPDNEEVETKNLYYSLSAEKCREQIAFYSTLPGFKDKQDGFEVMQTKLEHHYWESGFVTYTY